MLSRKLRCTLLLLVVFLGILLTAPARALPREEESRVAAAPVRLTAVLWDWLVDLWPGSLRKNGVTIDPNGAPLPGGGGPNGAAAGPGGGENGMIIDPNG